MKTLHTDNGAGHAAATRDRLPSLFVNTESFVHALRCHHPDEFPIAIGVYRAVHGRMPDTEDDYGVALNYADLPAALPLGPLLDVLPGAAALRALEHVKADIGSAMDVILLDIATGFVLPALAADIHPAQDEAEALCSAYRAWMSDPSAAGQYAVAASAFKDHWLGFEAAQEPAVYRGLLEALPIGGVDDRCYEGARPALRWGAFGHYLAMSSAEGEMIETLRDRLEGDDPSDEADNGAEAWWNTSLDDQIDALEAEKLAEHDPTIKRLIRAALENPAL